MFSIFSENIQIHNKLDFSLFCVILWGHWNSLKTKHWSSNPLYLPLKPLWFTLLCSVWGPLKIDTNRWSQQTTWPLSAKEWKKLWKTWWFHCCYLAKRKWQTFMWVILNFSSMFGSGVLIIDKNNVHFFPSSCVRAIANS